MDPIESLLLGQALDTVLRGGKAAASRFFTSSPTERLLVPLIEPHLLRTPAGDRRALAESIARSAARAAPYVVNTLSEATGAIAARTERIGEGLLAAMAARDRDGALARALVQGPAPPPVHRTPGW